MSHQVEKNIGGKKLVIRTGHMARQAAGAVTVQYGDTMILAAAGTADPRPGLDFFPLTMDYRERTAAAGKFPGGFIKREGRPTQKEILTMRLMDRPIRPLFPDGFRDEVQIQAMVLAADQENDPDILALIGASAALHISKIPFMGPVGAVRVGRVDEEFVLNPSLAELTESSIDLVVAGTSESVTMVEAGANQVPETVMLDAIRFGHEAIREIAELIDELRDLAGVEKLEFTAPQVDAELAELAGSFHDDFLAAQKVTGKHDRKAALDEVKERAMTELAERFEDPAELEVASKALKSLLADQIKKTERELILSGRRIDGRRHDEIRDISIEVGLIPRVHGSALFTRGETQALVIATLGTSMDEQRVDGLTEEYTKKFMLDYNFPPFCVGEVRPIRGPSRREIGHGALAERSVKPVLPHPDKFPYTVRLISDVLESNGSSSMATVCGGTLALMDAGVSIRQPVGGIAMGLIKDGDDIAILSDILGNEDHHGDMDFKVAGTQHGITGLQMDIKTAGISDEIMERALEQARQGRLHILREMLACLGRPRQEISEHAPRLLQIRINPDKIGLVIGPGGKQVKKIQEETGAKVEIVDDSGLIQVASVNEASALAAIDRIKAITEDVEIGKIYEGRVVSVKDFGAFVEVLPGQEGLLHISELADGFVDRVTDVVQVGDIVKVKVLTVDDQGRIKLSRKALDEETVGR